MLRRIRDTTQRFNRPQSCSRRDAVLCSAAGYTGMGVTMHISRAIPLFVFLLAADASMAASERDWNDCDNKEPERSIRGCTRVLQDRGETAKDRAGAHYNRGLAYHEKGDYDRAIADYDASIRLNPDFPYAYGSRGRAYHAKGDYDAAIADYDETIRLAPRVALTYNNRGVSYLKKGDTARAIEDLKKALEVDPKFALSRKILLELGVKP
jgi:tetratricopeptide (TPR) repeat protein